MNYMATNSPIHPLCCHCSRRRLNLQFRQRPQFQNSTLSHKGIAIRLSINRMASTSWSQIQNRQRYQRQQTMQDYNKNSASPKKPVTSTTSRHRNSYSNTGSQQQPTRYNSQQASLIRIEPRHRVTTYSTTRTQSFNCRSDIHASILKPQARCQWRNYRHSRHSRHRRNSYAIEQATRTVPQ